MTDHRRDRRAHSTSSTHWYLVGHIIATLLLAILAVVAVWIVLCSGAPDRNAGWGGVPIMPAQIF